MAEVIFRTILKENGLDKEYSTSSCGTHAEVGCGMSEGSKYALKELGMLVKKHKSKKATDSLLKKAHLVICMTERHKNAVINEKISEKCHSMSDISRLGDVSDPYMMENSVYLRTAEDLQYSLNELLEFMKNHENK